MNMVTNTLGRYFAGRFVMSAIGVFASIFMLLVLVDYIEMVRKTSGLASASAVVVAQVSLFRVPQLLEKMMPFCVLIGAMTCYLALSRRLELVVARAAGVSAWQFISPALASALALGILATVAYNPMSATMRERSKQMEAELFGNAPGGGVQDASGFWINQTTSEGQAIINAARSEKQGVRLTGLTVFRFDPDYQFIERIEAREATLEDGQLAVQIRAPIHPERPSGRSGNHVACHRPDPSAGAQQFLHPGDCVILATAGLYQVFGELGICHCRLPTAVPKAHRTAVFADRHGDVGGLGEPAVLPLRRRPKDGFEWRGIGLSALCFAESNRGFEQG